MSKDTQRKMVEKYLQEHDLETVMNEVVNKCVKERPTDPFLFLSTHMKELSSTSSGIKSIVARQIYDPRGTPTVYAEVTTFQGQFSASVPIADEREDPSNLGMVEKRDKDGTVTSCLKSINVAMSKAIVGKNPLDQDAIDRALVDLDGTDRYSKIGANAILAVSMACCRAGAAEKQVPLYKHIADLCATDSVNLPVPFFNVIAGGKHVKKTNIPYQEFMVAPIFAKTFREAFELGLKYYKILGEVLLEKYGDSGFTLQQVNDQGAYTPPIDNAGDALQCICDAFEKGKMEDHFRIAINVSGSELKYTPKDGEEEDEEEEEGEDGEPKEKLQKYNLIYSNPDIEQNVMDSDALMEEYNTMFESFPEAIISMEDPYAADDLVGFQKFTEAYGESMQVVGGELLASNADEILKHVETKAINAITIKMDQVGTVGDCLRAAKAAKECGWGVTFGQRLGETEDSFIADLVVGCSGGQYKGGAPRFSERMAKYNRLLCIEEECQDLKMDAPYVGISYRLPPS